MWVHESSRATGSFRAKLDTSRLPHAQACDVVTINCPLHPETEHLFDAKMINKMKRGSYIVNTARGKICDR